MPKKIVSVEVESSGLELMQAAAKLAKVCKEQLKDGFQAGQDLPVIVVEAVKDFSGAVGAVASIGADVKEDVLSFAKGVNLGAYEVADAILK